MSNIKCNIHAYALQQVKFNLYFFTVFHYLIRVLITFILLKMKGNIIKYNTFSHYYLLYKLFHLNINLIVFNKHRIYYLLTENSEYNQKEVLFIESILNAMQYGSKKASELFPIILQFKNLSDITLKETFIVKVGIKYIPTLKTFKAFICLILVQLCLESRCS